MPEIRGEVAQLAKAPEHWPSLELILTGPGSEDWQSAHGSRISAAFRHVGNLNTDFDFLELRQIGQSAPRIDFVKEADMR